MTFSGPQDRGTIKVAIHFGGGQVETPGQDKWQGRTRVLWGKSGGWGWALQCQGVKRPHTGLI